MFGYNNTQNKTTRGNKRNTSTDVGIIDLINNDTGRKGRGWNKQRHESLESELPEYEEQYNSI